MVGYTLKSELIEHLKSLDKYNDKVANILDKYDENLPNSVCFSSGGDVKYCPRCKKIRATSCCACGCGRCYSCGHVWSCYFGASADLTPEFWEKYFKEQNAKLPNFLLQWKQLEPEYYI